MRIIAFADDATGALEVGAKFAACGLRSLVSTELSLDPVGMDDGIVALVIDTETRHMPPAEAEARIYRLACAARERKVRYLIKKTDSTLRGNIAGELRAVTAAYPGRPVLYIPAYPRMRRTVRGGRLYVDGVPVSETSFGADRLNPVTESHIPSLLAASHPDIRVAVVDAGRLEDIGAAGVYVVDAESEREVREAAIFLAQSDTPGLAAGPAGFVEYFAESVDLPRSAPAPWPAVRSCLVVNGSRHESSSLQVKDSLDHGCPWASQDLHGSAITSGAWSILKIPSGLQEAGEQFAGRLGELAVELLNRVDFDGILVIGGDTVHGILRCLGQPAIHPLGEVLPGIPFGLIRAGDARKGMRKRQRDLCLITKAGGFGAPDILRLVDAKLSRK